MSHEYYIKRTFLLAKKGLGRTSPNPIVGAVLVKNNEILGEGYHKTYRAMHAEINAINQAVKKHGHNKLENSTLYVNLEPCCHYGSNPACTDIIISYGIKEVVYAAKDPNPLINGRSKKVLEDFGIKVTSGVLEKEAIKLNEVFFKYITKKIPFVYLKTALSLDGRITHPHKKYLSNKMALHYTHQLRNNVDAVLVGHNTFLHDKPKLTCRLPNGKNPKRIILPNRFVDLKKLLQELGEKKISSLLIEGGSQTITSFLEAKLIDKVILCYVPEIFGDKQLSFCKKLSKITWLKDIEVKQLGNNIIIEGYVVK